MSRRDELKTFELLLGGRNRLEHDFGDQPQVVTRNELGHIDVRARTQASRQKGPLLAGVPTAATANTAAQTAVKIAAQNPT
jgi:hypothetical protein